MLLASPGAVCWVSPVFLHWLVVLLLLAARAILAPLRFAVTHALQELGEIGLAQAFLLRALSAGRLLSLRLLVAVLQGVRVVLQQGDGLRQLGQGIVLGSAGVIERRWRAGQRRRRILHRYAGIGY